MTQENGQNKKQFSPADWALTAIILVLGFGIAAYAFIKVPAQTEVYKNLRVALPALTILVIQFHKIIAGLAILIGLFKIIFPLVTEKEFDTNWISVICIIVLVIMAVAMYVGMELPLWKVSPQLGK